MASFRNQFFVAALGVWCSVLCASPQPVLAQSHASGLSLQSNEVDFDVDLANDAVRQGLDVEPQVVRGVGNSLIHYESIVPLRLQSEQARADLGDVPGRFLAAFKTEMGLKGVDSLVVDRVRELKGGRIEHVYRQFHKDYPVLNSRVAVTVDSKGGLLRLSGRFLTEDLLLSIPKELPSYYDLAASFPSGMGEEISGVGIFHGSVFGMTTWEGRAPTLAFVTIKRDDDGRYWQTFVDWQTGKSLYSLPLSDGVTPPVDMYSDVDCMYSTPYFYLDSPVRLESTQTCGQGNYALGCSWWPGDSTRINTTAHDLGDFFDSQFGRYSWDGGQLPECDPNNPNIDPNQCCNLDNPSVMVAAANWLADDVLEQACCVAVSGGFCPGEVLGERFDNSFFMQFGCYTAYGHGTSCTDVIGHEFAHGVDFSEKQTARCVADDANGIYCRHEEAMAEAWPDILGESFQQIVYPTEGTPWVLNDGQAYCSPIRNLATPENADHASTIDWYETDRGTRMHDNSTALSKGLHLLGRPATEGSTSYYGVSVTGIGISDAVDVFYQALTEELPDTTDRSFSDLRQALLSSAGSQFGYSSTQYYATEDMVEALGFWTKASSWVQALSSPPKMGVYGQIVSTEYTRAIVFQESGSLKYSYRYQTYVPPFLRWVWSTPTTIAATTGSFDVYTEIVIIGGIPFGTRLNVYYADSLNRIRHFAIERDGTTSDNALLYNGSAITVKAGSAIRFVPDGKKLFYVPSGTTTVKWADVSGNTVTSPVSTSIPVTSGFDVDYQGGRYHAFWLDNNVLNHKATYGTNWYAVNTPMWLNTTDFALESDGGSLHVMMKNTTKGWIYQSCRNDCTLDTDWTMSAPIDPKPDTDSLWASLSARYNDDLQLGLAMQKATGNAIIRGK